MNAVSADVSGRLGEISAFLAFVKQVQKSGRLSSSGFGGLSSSVPVLKACTFLLLYNVVESCVRASLAHTYGEMHAANTDFASATDSIQKLWLRQELAVPTDSANHQTYVDATVRIAGMVSTSTLIELDARRLPISGNLNAESIRQLCRKHGIQLSVSKWAKGGVELETVKQQRNALAHGDKSFSECGRDYGVDDLGRIFRQTSHFLNGFQKSVARFNSKGGYKRP